VKTPLKEWQVLFMAAIVQRKKNHIETPGSKNVNYKSEDICVICFWCEQVITTIQLEAKDTIEWTPTSLSKLPKSATQHKNCEKRPDADNNSPRLLAN
jgi:hypothetical protein